MPDEPATDKPTTSQPITNKPTTDTPTTDQPTTDAPIPEELTADGLTPGKPEPPRNERWRPRKLRMLGRKRDRFVQGATLVGREQLIHQFGVGATGTLARAADLGVLTQALQIDHVLEGIGLGDVCVSVPGGILTS